MSSEQYYLIMVIIGAVGVFLSVKTAKQNSDDANSKVLWDKIDEQRKEVQDLRNYVNEKHFTAEQTKEFFTLASQGWTARLEHIENELSSVKGTLDEIRDLLATKSETDAVLRSLIQERKS